VEAEEESRRALEREVTLEKLRTSFADTSERLHETLKADMRALQEVRGFTSMIGHALDGEDALLALFQSSNAPLETPSKFDERRTELEGVVHEMRHGILNEVRELRERVASRAAGALATDSCTQQ